MKVMSLVGETLSNVLVAPMHTESYHGCAGAVDAEKKWRENPPLVRCHSALLTRPLRNKQRRGAAEPQQHLACAPAPGRESDAAAPATMSGPLALP